jgi:hypothetical protein
MQPGWWALAGADALAAALLVNGGVAKLVSPAQLARALGELVPLGRGWPVRRRDLNPNYMVGFREELFLA